MKFKSKKQRQAVMASLSENKSNTSKFQDRMKKTREKSPSQTQKRYDVYENGKLIDSVFYTNSNEEDVRKSLIDHDNYNSNIVVKEEKKEKKSKDNFKDKKEFSEKDVNLVKRRLNDGKIKNQNEIFGDAEGNFTNKELTKEQQQKGKDYLIDQWKTPNGVEIKNNPMRYREQEILNNFDRIELKEYHDISRYGQKPYYVPMYQVYSKDGDSMEYYVDSNGVNIVG